jgi:hypothetical protein
MSTGRIQAQKTTFCNKCQAMVAWQRSYTSYKWYLTNVDNDGLTARADFHKCQGNHLQTVCDDTQAVIDHNAMEQAIKANRDVLNQSLNSLLVTTPTECQGDICPPTNFKLVKPTETSIVDQPDANGTVYGAYQAVNYYLNHVQAVGEDRRLKSVLVGPNRQIDLKALELAKLITA